MLPRMLIAWSCVSRRARPLGALFDAAGGRVFGGLHGASKLDGFGPGGPTRSGMHRALPDSRASSRYGKSPSSNVARAPPKGWPACRVPCKEELDPRRDMTSRRRRSLLRAREESTSRVAPVVIVVEAVEVLVGRSRRLLRCGEVRRALVALRQACALDEGRARPYALLGALLLTLGRATEAEGALRHARWLRVRAGEPGRAASTQRLLDRAVAAAA